MARARDELSLLVETERRLEAELAATRAEAAGLVEAARKDAEDLERRLAADVAAALDALKAEIGAERERRVAEIKAESRRAVRAYDEVDDTRVAELADTVVSDLVSAGMEQGT